MKLLKQLKTYNTNGKCNGTVGWKNGNGKLKLETGRYEYVDYPKLLWYNTPDERSDNILSFYIGANNKFNMRVVLTFDDDTTCELSVEEEGLDEVARKLRKYIDSGYTDIPGTTMDYAAYLASDDMDI